MTDKSQQAGKTWNGLKKLNQYVHHLVKRLWPSETQPNKPEPQSTAEQLAPPVPQSPPLQVREGWWRTRGGTVKNVRLTPPERGVAIRYPWWDGNKFWNRNGRFLDADYQHEMDLLTYLGPIESAAIDERAELGGADQTRAELQARIHELEVIRDKQAAAIEELKTSLRTRTLWTNP